LKNVEYGKTARRRKFSIFFSVQGLFVPPWLTRQLSTATTTTLPSRKLWCTTAPSFMVSGPSWFIEAARATDEQMAAAILNGQKTE
jgi:hypothetical protein